MNKIICAVLLAGLVLTGGPGKSQVATQRSQRPTIVESMPDHLRYIYQAEFGGPTTAGSQIQAERRRWPLGYVLKVCFFGGNPVVHSLIAKTAVEWNEHSAVKLDFGVPDVWRNCANPSSGFSQVRIGFGERGYWSAIGNDSNSLLNASQPSMNLEGFDLKYSPYQFGMGNQRYTQANVIALSDLYDRGTILHEFGHALSLLHEHQNPTLNCHDELRWTESPTVYDYYARPPNNWNRDKVDFNIGSIALSNPDYVAGAPDPKSIMMYAQPAEVFKHGSASRCYVQPNNVLSALDRAFIRQIYPASTVAVSDTEIGGTLLPAVSQSVASSPASVNDLLSRVRVDLNSDQPSVRREARRQLAGLLQTAQSPQLAAALANESLTRSYRDQLGLASALAHSSLPFDDSPAAKATTLNALQTMIQRNQANQNDQILRQKLQLAVEAVTRD